MHKKIHSNCLECYNKFSNYDIYQSLKLYYKYQNVTLATPKYGPHPMSSLSNACHQMISVNHRGNGHPLPNHHHHLTN